MRFSINSFLITSGVILFGAAIYRFWDYPLVKIFLTPKIDANQIDRISFKENEVFAVSLLERSSENCWYENNYDIVIHSNIASQSKVLLKALTFEDTIPSRLKIIVPDQPKVEFRSASFPVEAHWQREDSIIAFSLFNLPLTNLTSSSESDHGGAACCSTHPGESYQNHSCLQLSPDCSAAPAVRGYTHLDWHQWFEIKEFNIESVINRHSSDDRLLYHLSLRLHNKKLNDFIVYFRDLPGKEWQDLVLQKAPEDFSSKDEIHQAQYHDFKAGDELELEFYFALISPNQNLKVIERLIEIESNHPGLLYPRARLIGQQSIERHESNKMIFILNVPL